MTNELKQEFTLRISQANKTQMIVILYEIAMVYLKDGISAHEKKERDVFKESIRKARGCVNELMESLNFEQELAKNFLQLYLYLNKELVKADVRNEIQPLQDGIKIIASLHEAYLELSKQDTSKPVMSNAQSVYAGLTYGRGDLSESLSDQGINRGFRV